MKLLALLKSLRPEEHKEFEKFLQSPFFKASDQYLKFFRFLCKRYPAFELSRTEMQEAYRSCFGPKSLTDSKLYNLLSGLGKQVEQFLAVQMVLDSDNPTGSSLHDQLLVKSLGMRNTGAYFRAEARRLIEETSALPILEITDYHSLQQLHHYIYFNPDTPKAGEHTVHLQRGAERLEQHFCIATLRYAAEMMTRKRVFDIGYELPMLDAVLERSATSGLTDRHPLWATYYRLVNLYRQGVQEPGFRNLMEVFTDRFQVMPKADRTNLLRHLINCGISLIARDCAVEAELLSLYKLSIDNGLLLDGNRISHVGFVNIANLSSVCKEFEWTEAFIARFAPHLEESKREAAVDLAKAGLYYNMGLLDAAQNCLTPLISDVPDFVLVCRGLLLKIVFDRYILYDEDYEFLSSYLKSFEKFVQVKPLPPEKRDAYLNWIRFVRKMAATRFEMVKVTTSGKESLRKKLGKLQPVVAKNWSEAKIEAI